MSYSYNEALTTDVDFVRLWGGDRIVSGSAQFHDEELEAIIDSQPNKWYAAAALVEMKRAKALADLANGGALLEKQVEDYRERFSQGDVGTLLTNDVITKYVDFLRAKGGRETAKKPYMFRVLGRTRR